MYYLMIAEGGTSFNHAVMIAISDNITGPYISNDRNPILTTRHLSYDNWVHSTGHADLIELDNGRWYMVLLGVRGEENRGSNMGRETHLVPVVWEQEPFDWKEKKYEWPVCAPQSGKVERTNPVPFQNTIQLRQHNFRDDFDSEKLNLEWNFRRVPADNTYSLNARAGYLRLYTSSEVIRERGSTSLMGFRQKESDFEFRVSMDFQPKDDNAEAGICLFQKDNKYITFTAIKKDNDVFLQIKLAKPGQDIEILEQRKVNVNAGVQFKVISSNHTYRYYYLLGPNTDKFQLLKETDATQLLSNGYTGAYLGVYSSGNGKQTNSFADYDWVEYQEFQR
jgi:alpha-N-arabinofuranosidase